MAGYFGVALNHSPGTISNMDTAEPPPPRRKSPRHPAFDYRLRGWYFITICAVNRACIFGEIVDSKMKHNPLGNLVEVEWNLTPSRRENLRSVVHVVMPNHFHALVMLDNTVIPRKQRHGGQFGPASSDLLGTIIGAFKSAVTTHARKAGMWSSSPLWQQRFYDRVVRDQSEFFRIKAYVQRNPERWANDEENPAYAGEGGLDSLLDGNGVGPQ